MQTMTRRHALAVLASLASTSVGAQRASAAALSLEDDEFLEELSRRAFRFVWEMASPKTGMVRDRARNQVGGDRDRIHASSAATGFGLPSLAIAAERGWLPRQDARERTATTMRYYLEEAFHDHGWFYHFVDYNTGERWRESEISSIDTALLLAGVLAVKHYWKDDQEIPKLADAIYERVDFEWMLNGHPYFLSHGLRPETGFLPYRWEHYCELAILYVLAIGSPTSPIRAQSWYAWDRPMVNYAGYRYVGGPPALFVHQYSHAFIDFRGLEETRGPRHDWWQNSVDATLAHRQFCIDLGKSEFPGCYNEDLWGITASDSARGYEGWGGPPRHPRVDGSIVPCAAGGSLMLEPKLCVTALRAMQEKFGERIWGHYGFADAFHPLNGWTAPDCLGIDQGITLLSAENARTGCVWEWFMQEKAVQRALDQIGLA